MHSPTLSLRGLAAQHDYLSADGGVVAMMPDVYHHPMNGMPPPMCMPGYEMPMMSTPEVYQAKHSLCIIYLSVALVLGYPLTPYPHLSLVRWNSITL